MTPDIKEIRKQYMENPPQGMSKIEIMCMSDDDLLDLYDFWDDDEDENDDLDFL